MQVDDLGSLVPGATIETDLVIVGGGAAGLTIAREFFGTTTRVVVIESGKLEEDAQLADLNTVESIGEPAGAAQAQQRREFHGSGLPFWSHESQGFGVRCRVLGGSTHAWAGKSAAFDQIDFAERAWVPYSGWPFSREVLEPYLDRAAGVLNLGPNCYDDKLWKLIGVAPPGPQLNQGLLTSFFWQFARSRLDAMDIMRFGPEFLTFDAPNVRVVLNATVTCIDTNEDGTAFESIEISTIDGIRSRVRARSLVLAAGGIENPRLLLVSNKVHRNGLGNRNDLVGRFLMDHPGARIGHFTAKDCPSLVKRFGFYGVRHEGRTHMYSHGLVLSREFQERERLLNCAIYMIAERAPDDPWDALKRLLRAKSERPISDMLSVASSPGLLAKGIGMRLFESNLMPQRVRRLIVDTVIKQFPNFAVLEYQNRGLPHKLTDLVVYGITEQRPNPESRITLSDKTDALGVPVARVNWNNDYEARRSLARLAHVLVSEFSRAGLPTPQLENWVAEQRPQDSVAIDMGHTAGTTRMSDDPASGVVDSDCRVHGVHGIYIAGGSVFPTSGHANPTLMILALAIRLADRIKADLAH